MIIILISSIFVLIMVIREIISRITIKSLSRDLDYFMNEKAKILERYCELDYKYISLLEKYQNRNFSGEKILYCKNYQCIENFSGNCLKSGTYEEKSKCKEKR